MLRPEQSKKRGGVVYKNKVLWDSIFLHFLQPIVQTEDQSIKITYQARFGGVCISMSSRLAWPTHSEFQDSETPSQKLNNKQHHHHHLPQENWKGRVSDSLLSPKKGLPNKTPRWFRGRRYISMVLLKAVYNFCPVFELFTNWARSTCGINANRFWFSHGESAASPRKRDHPRYCVPSLLPWKPACSQTEIVLARPA